MDCLRRVGHLDLHALDSRDLDLDQKTRMKSFEPLLQMFLPKSPRRTSIGILLTIGILAVFVVIPDMRPEALWLILWMAWAFVFRWPFQVFMRLGIFVTVFAALLALITPQGGQQILILALGFVAGGWVALLCDRPRVRD